MTWSTRCSPQTPTMLWTRSPRAEAVSEVRGSEDFVSISIAFKRIKNILRQARETSKSIAGKWDDSGVTEDAEEPNWQRRSVPRFLSSATT